MIKKILGASLVVGLSVGLSQAALMEDFESYTAGTSIHGLNNWSAINQTATQGTLVSALNSPLGPAGSRSMRFNDADATAGLGNGLTYRQVNGQLVGGIGAFSFDFMATVNAQTPQVLLQLAGTTAVQMTITPNGGGTGVVRYHNGSGFQTIGSGLSLGTWYTFTLTADVNTDTFGLVVSDGTSTVISGSNLGFRNAVTDLNRIAFTSNAAAGQTGADYNFDNVNVVPEPATLGLVGLAGLGLIAMRRFRM